MGDAFAGIGGELRRVVAADEQVPGVEAPAHVGAFQDGGDVGGRLDEGADVRVQRLGERVLGTQLVELGEHPKT